MEESFPRGGSQKKAEQKAVLKRPKENDGNLFSTHHEEEPEIKKNKKVSREKPKAVGLEKRTTSTKEIVEIPLYSKLSVGMLFLGCVKRTKDFELTVSLPYCLTGYIQATNICDAYTNLISEQVEKDDPLEALVPLSELYSPGMLVRCAISSLETTASGFPSVKLSVNPKHVNKALNTGSIKTGMVLSGCVSSVEDHGYLVDIGVAGTKAFLPRQKAQLFLSQAGQGSLLRVGEYLNCVVEEVKNEGKIVRLSIIQNDVASALATVEQNWNLNNLLPGLVFKAQIEKVMHNNITLSFLSSYTGFVDFLHFEPKKIGSYKEGQEVKACILWLDPSTKTIRLTLRQCFLQPGNTLPQLTSDWVGSVLDNCVVQTLFKNAGAVFELEGGNLGFAFKHHLSASKQPHFEKFKKGTTHKGRITDFSPMDEMHILSLKEKVITNLFLRHEDIQPGQVLEGTVKCMEAVGMVVQITDHLTGLVPKLHFADVLLKHPEKKYIIGNKIKCKVLTVVTCERKLILTRKRTLMKSTLPVLASYEDAQPGLITHGFIVAIKDYGCLVKFYNEVQGLAPRRELGSLQEISSLEDAFYRGQVIKVQVLECNPQTQQLLLSFRITEEGHTEQEQRFLKKIKAVKLDVGKLVDIRVLSKTDKGVNVLVLPEESPAFIPKMHLSDHVSNCELLWHTLQEGDDIPGAMCLSSLKGHSILTKKSLLISSVEKGSCVKVISEVQTGMHLTGFVKSIMPYGVFVEFPYGLFGLVPMSEISDKFVTNIRDHFVEGNTVVATVIKMDEEKKRFLLTLKMSECAPDDYSIEGLFLLSQCFSELQLMKGLLARKGDPEDELSIYTLIAGQKLTLVVENAEENGPVQFSAGSISGAQTVSATQYHIGDKALVAGQKVKAVVLHVDMLTLHVHVSLNQTLLKKKQNVPKMNSSHSADVQHVAEEFAVVSLADSAHLIAVPVSSHLNDTFRFESEKLKVGETISVILKTTTVNEHGLLLAVQNKAASKTSKNLGRTTQSAMRVRGAISHGLKIGDLVTGTVKSIKPTQVTVSINDNVFGFIHVSQIMDETPQGCFPTSKLNPKQEVTCRVIGGREVKTHRYLPITHPDFIHSVPELSLLPELINTDNVPKPRALKTFNPGDKVTCYVNKFNTETKYLEVEITPEIRGRIELLLLSQTPKNLKRPEKLFKNGQALSATVVGPDAVHKHLCLSLTGIHSLEEGAVTVACVTKVVKGSGLTLSLPFGKTGNANMFHLCDKYAEASLEKFTPGKFVRCAILSNSKIVKVSLRQSRVNQQAQSSAVDEDIASIDSLEEGQLVSGFVSAITENKGVFFRLSSFIVGHIQFQNVTSYFVYEPSAYSNYIPEGTLLTAKVLSIDPDKKHVELSLLPTDTGKPDVVPESAGFSKRKNKASKKTPTKRKRENLEKGSQDTGLKKKKSHKSIEDDDSGVEVYCREEDAEDKTKKTQQQSQEQTSSQASVSRLQVSSGFLWDVSLNTLKTSLAGANESSSDSDEEEDEQPKKKKTKKELAKEKKEAEKELSKKEATLLDSSRQPQSADDFDRLVISSPDSSILWLQYMAFHLHATEIEKARVVAERALKTISFREEQEKLNVWVALLNLENMYGTEESLTKAFERAVQYNEPLKVFQQLADIYIKSEKFKQAEDLYNTMLKRFRQEKSVWIKFATFLLKQGQGDGTHKLLQRALKSLPEKDHVDVISKFAQLEFQLGDTERAKALFESTLSSYPKRTDLWSVYIDMMVKHGSQKEVRDIFERVIHLSLAAKKIKFFFKRYLEYEKKHGSTESVQAVKEKALQYVESQSSLAAT
ncbi:programmed cell death 11 L homeolog [Xenopus laevis]|uniref:Protein RRP5 homolog n=2 Tax=Xenopus laevis TaxID=8355 RepID=B3DLK9_XENLA|nr:programmed cell death 11 L homeolog [Xenopus laevis]AAI67486.1 LOC779090 protein [Xenopus laevis]